MNERLKKVTTTINTKWTGMSRKGKYYAIFIPLGIIAVAVALTVILNIPSYSVLFSGVSSDEAAQIAAAINELGVSDVSIKSNGDIVVPKNQEDQLRFQLNMQGYPTSGFNYEDEGTDLFTTDTQLREKYRRQYETRIANTISSFSSISSAVVNLYIPEQKNYVLVTDKEEPSAAVTVTLKPGKSLSGKEVLGIYNTVIKSVSSLKPENVSVVDSDGMPLLYSETGESATDDISVAYARLSYKKEFEKLLRENLSELFVPVYGDDKFSAVVNATLNYDKEVSETVDYTPSVGDSGMIEHEEHTQNGTGTGVEDGVVGTTPNADSSPDYPTLVDDGTGTYYYEKKDEIDYLVNTAKKQLQKDGYSVENLTVSLAIDDPELTDAEKLQIAQFAATAVGTSAANVSVLTRSFVNSDTIGTGAPIIVPGENNLYRVLLYIFIAVGVLLVILLIVSLLLGGGKKQKKVKQSKQVAVIEPEEPPVQEEIIKRPPPVEFHLPSLTEEAARDSKETVLKREIGDFAKSSPEIAASLIKNMLRDDE